VEELRASRIIEEGEEILDCYLDLTVEIRDILGVARVKWRG
jgi:hypothetical protein